MFVGWASDRFARTRYSGFYEQDCLVAAPNEACNAASAHGLTMAMLITATLFLWAIFHLLMAARTIRAELNEDAAA
jgi:hypothetical protein